MHVLYGFFGELENNFHDVGQDCDLVRSNITACRKPDFEVAKTREQYISVSCNNCIPSYL